MAPALELRALREAEREDAARLYWEAFSDQIGRALGPRDKALATLRAAIRPANGLAAVSQDGRLLGLAGVKVASEGSFMMLDTALLTPIYGRAGALWRGLLLDMFERGVGPGELLTEGLCVAAGWRGRGIGSALIAGLLAEARARGLRQVRLEVTDANPRARALYERQGFVPVARRDAGLAAPVLGFRRSTQLVYRL